MDVNLTSTWIPMSLLSVLSLYMFFLFLKERREAAAYEASGGDAAHGVDANALMAIATAPQASLAAHGSDAHGNDAHAGEAHGHASEPHAAPAAADHGHAPAKAKAALKWRTAHLWLPFVAGFGWQGYLDIIRPMLEKVGN